MVSTLGLSDYSPYQENAHQCWYQLNTPSQQEGYSRQDPTYFEVHKLLSRQCLHQNINYLLISGDVLKPYHSPLYHVTDVVELDLNIH